MLKIPASTLRRYSVDFADQLSDSARHTGHKRTYADDDVLTLRRIRKLSGQRLAPAEIRARLAVMEPESPSSALALMPEILNQFESLRADLAQAHEKIDHLQARLDVLEMPWYRRLFKR